jgi:hypothetical protein
MNERIKELAEEFAMLTETMTGIQTEYIFDDEDLERFAELVRQDEREACAKLCEYLPNKNNPSEQWLKGTIDCATAIRARTE